MIKGRTPIKVGVRVQPGQLGADLPSVSRTAATSSTRTDGFLNYARNPNYVECSNGTHVRDRDLPGRHEHHRAAAPVPAAGRRRRALGRGGGHPGIPQIEPAVFVQDKWQPNRNLTVQYGLRWEVQKQPDPITPPSEVFYARLHRQDRPQPGAFPSDGTIPSDKKMWQPRSASRGIPTATASTVVRLNGGIFYARIPGLSPRDHRAPPTAAAGQSALPRQLFNGFGVAPSRPTRTCIPRVGRSPDRPRRVRVRRELREPAHRVVLGRVRARRSAKNLSVFASTPLEDGAHHALHQPERPAARVAPGAPASGRTARTASAHAHRRSSPARPRAATTA